MDLLLLAEFLLIACLVVATAWEIPAPRVTRLLVSCGFKNIFAVFIVLWIPPIIVFWWLFWGRSEVWQILALLIEMAGVTYLALEVRMAQNFDTYRRIASEIGPFVALETLPPERYVTEYYRMDGRAPREAEVEIAVRKLTDTLAEKVAELKARTRGAYQGPKKQEESTLNYRRNRLYVGYFLVTLGLAGHGLHMLMPEEQSEIASFRHAVTETQSNFNNSISQIQKHQAELSQQIGYLERNGASQAKEIATIAEENKRWHVVRVRKPQPASSDHCCCMPTSLSCQSK